MGSYDGAEVCELSCIFILSLIGNKYNPNNIGLYKDDELAIFKNTSGRNNRNRLSLQLYLTRDSSTGALL